MLTDGMLDALRALVAEHTELRAENETLRSRLNDALAWLGTFREQLHPIAAADLHGILTGQPVGDLIERN